MKKPLLLIVFLGLTFLFASTTLGATIHVPADQPTIQAGIDMASDGDTVMVSDGIYTGEGNKDLYIAGKAITVTSENGPHHCVVDCQGDGSGFIVVGDVVVSGFTVKNGSEGGISTGGEVTITNCIIAENTGSGVRLVYGQVTITDSIISDNEGQFGGGISGSDFSLVIITNCIVVGNHATYYGGGMYFTESEAAITNCTTVHNSAEAGGGMYVITLAGPHYYSVSNSIFWGNYSGAPPSQIWIGNPFPDQERFTHNNIDQDGYAGTDGNIRMAPVFVDSNNRDFCLRNASPGIDAGTSDVVKLYGIWCEDFQVWAHTWDLEEPTRCPHDPSHVIDPSKTYVVAETISNTDFAGYPRALDGNLDGTAEVDIGAYEYVLPVIKKLKPRTCNPGQKIRIIGSGFGDTQGNSVVHIGNKGTYDSTSSKIKLWTDTKIRIKIPFAGKPCEWFKHGDGEYRRKKVWVTVDQAGDLVDTNIERVEIMKPAACP